MEKNTGFINSVAGLALSLYEEKQMTWVVLLGRVYNLIRIR